VLAAEIDVGRRIAGKYELVRLLGKGAMGEVWLATHDTLGGEFAIKLVRPSEEPEDETAAGRFQLEAQVSAKLSRKTRHIVSVSDHGEEDGLAYLVMELLEGESLEARIKRVGQMDLPTVAAVVLQVGRALSQAHQEGIFHRDLKPANIFLSKDEDGRLLVKLLDFGIARSKKPFSTRSPFATGKDMVLGTPSYMSPEQARGLDTLDYRCDIWALAVVAYEGLTGRIPWEGETVEDIFLSICLHRMAPLATLRPDLQSDVEAIFTRSFAPKLDDRYVTADELAADFEHLVDPADLDAALGVRAAPVSSRRMAVASRGSRPDAAAPSPPIRQSNPSYPQMGTEPAAFTVADGGTMRIKKNNGPIIAIIAVLLLLLFGGVGFVALNRKPPSSTTASDPPPPTSTATVVSTSVAPPPITADPAPAPPTSATAKTTAKPTPPTKTPPVTPTVASPPATTQQPAVATPPTPPTPPPSATPAPPPSAKGQHNRSEVF